MKKIIVNKWDIILISWIDAISVPGWKMVEDWSITPYYVDSIGAFLGETDDYWTIVLTHAWSNGQLADTLSIPKGMMTNVKIIKRAKTI